MTCLANSGENGSSSRSMTRLKIAMVVLAVMTKDYTTSTPIASRLDRADCVGLVSRRGAALFGHRGRGPAVGALRVVLDAEVVGRLALFGNFQASPGLKLASRFGEFDGDVVAAGREG